jgi:hypothetical protein
MKFSDVTLLLLVVGAIFTTVSLALVDVRTAYPDANIPQENFSAYQNTQAIEAQAESLQGQWAQIQDEDKGWKKFVTGLAAIPNVIIAFVAIVFNAFAIAGNTITFGALQLGAPSAIIGIMMAMLLVWTVFKLVAWWQRSPT